MPQTYEVIVEKLVHGGQGIATLATGKKALIWNVLPGEEVRFTPGRKKSSYVEGIADEIIKRSPEREEPRDELYLSTSPWQMMTYKAENKYKLEILAETLQRAGVGFSGEIEFYAPDDPWHYRNKMEYSFYGDDGGLHLALFGRGTHGKRIVQGSSIARPEIDLAATRICEVLDSHKVRAGDLKTVIVRCNRVGECAAAIFSRNENLMKLPELSEVCQGLRVYYSNPKSPASVITRELYSYGDSVLEDTLLNASVFCNSVAFFQVNLDPYEAALQKIKQAVGDRIVTDMYAGVGSIGLSVAKAGLKLVELDEQSAAMARLNAKKSGLENVEIILAASEKATEHIPGGKNQTVIFDPPRAGLHAKVVSAVLEKLPEQIVYLSCNPSTFGRDLNLLSEKYSIKFINGYNFFPRTPHIEALAVLERK